MASKTENVKFQAINKGTKSTESSGYDDMKRTGIILFIFLASSILMRGQVMDRPFKYPDVPESLESLQDRTTFLVEHFWERCNMKSIFSSKKNFTQAFDDYISFMPYADSATVFNSLDRLIKEVKKNPANMATMGSLARERLYSDTAEIRWDALYLPFAKAMGQNSSLSKEERQQYQLEAQQLENSMVGSKLSDFSMTLRDGSVKSLKDLNDGYLLILIDEPEDFNNTMARMRLATDYGLNDLISQGYVSVLSLHAGTPDKEWQERSASYPENWIVAASTETEPILDRRVKPTFYYLNKDHEILSKTLEVENLTEAFRSIINRRNRIKAEQQRLRDEAIRKQASNMTNPPVN